ncbi:MAG TPA: 6-carboxytetrahydropterin synthase [Tepidisphaeraceae bacterium]|jgi:6-pyruvoyltetrahydropterin/6-carboxytetrahydropterin synthase|nr:6-carboxytetrahydropterin synthase [Tepidisphaeraceae bacterium]
MHRLTREVRFAVNAKVDDQLLHPPANSYGGYPSLTGLGHYFVLAATLEGELAATGYLRNIKEIDQQVRLLAIPVVEDLVRTGEFTPSTVLTVLFAKLRHAWPGARLEKLRFSLSPFLWLETNVEEYPMTRLSQRFEFSASHRLHKAELSEAENQKAYGKCNNPHGHGHNYELQVTIVGVPDARTGLLVDVPAFERVVGEKVIARFDHKNLNEELEEFREVVPSVENIARVIYGLLKGPLKMGETKLAGVTVWETPKTFCEYTEE